MLKRVGPVLAGLALVGALAIAVPTATGQRQPSSKVTLTAEERQIARTSFTAPDMTNEQKELAYARNKQRLQKMRSNGEYPQPERN